MKQAGQAVIFDTDMGNDVDDALALAVLHALQSRGQCRLGEKKLADVAMTATVDGIPIATGVIGTATANLHIKIDILDSSPLQF